MMRQLRLRLRCKRHDAKFINDLFHLARDTLLIIHVRDARRVAAGTLPDRLAERGGEYANALAHTCA